MKINKTFFVVMVLASACNLGAMSLDNVAAARFNGIVTRAQLHFHNPKWLASDHGLYERHRIIINYLKQRDLSIDEFLNFFENTFDYMLLLKMRCQLFNDPIALQVGKEIFVLFKSFKDLPFDFSDQTEFLKDAGDFSIETVVRLGIVPENEQGLEAIFWGIFKFSLEKEKNYKEINRAYAIAYVQKDIVEILDGLKNIDNFGAREVTQFGAIAAKIVLLKKKLEVIAAAQNIPVAKDLSQKVTEFFTVFMDSVRCFCSNSKN
jgi:hypothetical protein